MLRKTGSHATRVWGVACPLQETNRRQLVGPRVSRAPRDARLAASSSWGERALRPLILIFGGFCVA